MSATNLHGKTDGDDTANNEKGMDDEEEEEEDMEEEDEEDDDDEDEDTDEIADWGGCYMQHVYFSQQEGLAQQKLNINQVQK